MIIIISPSPPYSPSLGMIPALIQGSNGSVPATVAPFNSSALGWSSWLNPGYKKAGCGPPKTPKWDKEPANIPGSPPWCRAVNPGREKLRGGCGSAPGRAGDAVCGLGRGEGVSEPRCDAGLSVGLPLWDPRDASSRSVRCPRSASMRKLLDLSMVEVIVPRGSAGKYTCCVFKTKPDGSKIPPVKIDFIQLTLHTVQAVSTAAARNYCCASSLR